MKARTGDINVAVDAMGGDGAPAIVIRGADIALNRYPNLRYKLFGDEALIQPLLDRSSEAMRDATELVHTDDYISGDDPPASAIRRRKSSLSLAIEEVKAKRADAVISAGNTGAFMALSYIKLKTLPGIDRPAIASFFPTLRGEACMLDLGANLKCTVDNLVQFAVMGNVFARLVLGVLYPSYGLLNVGTETLKGPPTIQEASERLQALSDASAASDSGGLPGRYIGFVEGDGRRSWRGGRGGRRWLYRQHRTENGRGHRAVDDRIYPPNLPCVSGRSDRVSVRQPCVPQAALPLGSAPLQRCCVSRPVRYRGEKPWRH